MKITKLIQEINTNNRPLINDNISDDDSSEGESDSSEKQDIEQSTLSTSLCMGLDPVCESSTQEWHELSMSRTHSLSLVQLLAQMVVQRFLYQKLWIISSCQNILQPVRMELHILFILEIQYRTLRKLLFERVSPGKCQKYVEHILNTCKTHAIIDSVLYPRYRRCKNHKAEAIEQDR